jgi:hypothetical protein
VSTGEWRTSRGPIWITGPNGCYWEFDNPDGPWHALSDQQVLFRHPAAHVVSLESLGSLGSWFDVENWTQDGAIFGFRSINRRVTGRVDTTTGMIVDYDVTDEYGGLHLHTVCRESTPVPVAVFSYHGPTRACHQPR